jgi:hypothetical protein
MTKHQQQVDRELFQQVLNWDAESCRKLAKIYARWAKLLRAEAKKRVETVETFKTVHLPPSRMKWN